MVGCVPEQRDVTTMRDHVIDDGCSDQLAEALMLGAERMRSQELFAVSAPPHVVPTLMCGAPVLIVFALAGSAMAIATTAASHKHTAHRARRGWSARHRRVESAFMDTNTMRTHCAKSCAANI